MMSPIHTHLKPGAHPYPHIGRFIRQKFHELHITAAEAARRLGVSTSTVQAYYKQPSLQFGIIFKLSIALNYDLLSDLISSYPPNFPVKPNEKLADLEKEVEILRGLLKR
ncbi:MAG: helix-turn-helix transcriptional regulator [Weeksellaceae bacterium]|nr:helix-turn-helix transcriptional regulator [Bacteroidota bacterium]MCG2781427.1 helix-turn-helix transcriptional regulator [Weeksellaceae bacterium]